MIRQGVLESGRRVTIRDERKIAGGWVCEVTIHPEDRDEKDLILSWVEPMCNIFDPETGNPLSPSIYRRVK